METVPEALRDVTLQTIFVWAFFLLAVATLASKVIKKVKGLTDKVNDFLDDWAGRPARPGVPRSPGLLERLTNLEEQLRPNNGGSLHDKVTKLSEEVTAITDYLKDKDSNFKGLW